MSFEPRPYADIVRDVLTTLTGGTIRERVVVPAGDGPIELTCLAKRPLRRISHMQGRVRVSDDPVTGEIDYRFTPADYELVGADGGGEPDVVRFRPQGRRPVPGSVLFVNYYPFDIQPPLTDLNVGSVVRTLLESVSAELAYQEQLLDQIYRSAFLETAEGKDLDKVVALVGIKRFPAGVATVRVRFTRTPGSVGRITVPAGVVVTDAPGAKRYATTVPLTLEPGEQARDVLAAAADAKTEPVSGGALDRLEVLIAGIGAVSNEAPSVAASQDETDEALRRRARSGLRVTARGTVEALLYGLKAVDGVKEVSVVEFPHGVAGEVRVDVVYERDDAKTRAAVQNRVDLLRPAGIRVLVGDAARLRVAVAAELELTDVSADGAQRSEIVAGVQARIAAAVAAVTPGGLIRNAPLVAASLADDRVADAKVTVAAEGGAPVDKLQLQSGVAAELILPVTITLPQPAVGGTADVHLTLPVTLEAGITTAAAEAAIRLAVEGHLTSRTSSSPLDLDGLAAAIRDDSRYVLLRAEAVATVESAGRFVQLTDGLGTYAPDPGQRLQLRTLALDVREGGR